MTTIMQNHATIRWIFSALIGLALIVVLVRLIPIKSSSALAGGDFAHSAINMHTGDAHMLADFTGDGKLDWAIGGHAGVEPLEIYPYPFNAGTKYRVADAVEEFTTDSEAADMDGDGDIDIVVPEWQMKTRLFLNGGNGQTWTEAGNVTTFSAGFKDVEIADFDRDGKNDVALRTDQETIYVQYNNGVNSAWQSVNVGQAGGAEGMDSGDVDGDGDMDIIGQGNWFENPGARSGGWQTHNIGQADAAFRAIVGDFNKDGKNDVAFSCAECGHGNGTNDYNDVRVYIQGSGGSFTGTTATTMNGAHSIEAGDFDGDGNVDIFVASMDGPAAVLVNNGTGTGWSRIDLAGAPDGVHIARAGDIDGDGDIDVVGSNFTGHSFFNFWENKTQKAGCVVASQLKLGTVCGGSGGGGGGGGGGGTASLDSWSATAKLGTDGTSGFYWRMLGTGTVAQADINGDGNADIASGQNVWISPGADAANAGAWQKFGGFINAAVIADIDRDGKTDDVVDTGDGSWYKWNGNGFTKKATPSGTARGEQGYVVGDIIPGGYLEVIYPTDNGAGDDNFNRQLVQYSASGATASFIAGGASDEGVDLADINGDGRLDIVGNDGDEYGWWENTGGTNFTKHMIGDRSSGFFSDKTLARDLNNDGKIEIIGSAETAGDGGDIYVFAQNGGDITAKSGWTRTIVYTQGSTNSMDLEDMDNDGYIDLITGDFRGSSLVVVKNPGNGSFSNWTPHTVSTDSIPHHGGTQAGDFNGDGILDVATIDWPGDTSSLYVWINKSTTGGGGGGGGGGGSCAKKAQGDADCNGTIGLSDFQIWRTEYVAGTTSKADFDTNGKTGLSDFQIWRTSYVGQ